MKAVAARRRDSIRRKLVGLVLAAVGTTCVVTATLVGWTDAKRQTTLEAERFTQTARVIGSLSADAVQGGDTAGAFRALRAIGQMPEIDYGRIKDSNGVLLAETGGGVRLGSDANFAEGESPSVWTVLNTGTIQVHAPIMSEGRPVGEILLLAQTPGLRDRVLGSVLIALAGTMIAALAGLLIALRLARRISTPLVRLAEFTNQVTASDDYSSDPDIEAEGEVADVASGLKAMLGGLRERDQRIADHVAGLEKTVALRTAELSEAMAVAEAANAAKSDFLAVMSHEIRTPMNGMLALSELLAKSELQPTQRRQAEVITKSGHALVGIINDILDFSKVESGKMELERLEVDLNALADDVAALFAQRARDKGLDLATYVDPGLGLVWGDPTRLRQVISNLINNAVKFTETGGVTLAITRSSAGDLLRIGVIDTGPGIPPDKLPGLFEAFSQEDQTTTRKHGGTGLGLAICDRLVIAMDGRWALASKVGRGSRFAFDLSLDPVEASEGPMPPDLSQCVISVSGDAGQTVQTIARYVEACGGSSSGDPAVQIVLQVSDHHLQLAFAREGRVETCDPLELPLRREELFDALEHMRRGERPPQRRVSVGQAADAVFPGARVLVADDSDVNREVAAEALRRLDAEVSLVCDGVEAVDAARTGLFDLILMDGSMPRLDGFEAAAEIRRFEAEDSRKRTPILALTAHVVGDRAEAWRGAGMDGVIHKPFTLDDITGALRTYCSGFEKAAPATVGATHPTPAGEDVYDLFDPAVRGELSSMASAGRADFVERVEALYAEHAPQRLAELSQAWDAGVADDVARAAHAMKSMSLSLGARAVADAASVIESDARRGTLTPGARESLGLLLMRTLQALTGAARQVDEEPDLAAEVRRAAAAGELSLVYQPMMARGGDFSGKVEALVRWTKADGASRRPDIFIPELEAAGAIAILTDHVLETAMTQVKARPDLKLSVNASASEFQRADFADRVKAIGARCGFDLSRLEIEVTETAVLDIRSAAPTLGRLAELGVGVALDDFGSGFTSLHALRELKFSTLKIDKSFVDTCLHDTASAAIIHAVIAVGRTLGMQVVCEGVESQTQASFLMTAGVHHIQGYFYSRPVTFDALPAPRREAA